MDSALIEQASEQFLGQWKQLVSTTNWEKGRIIREWRESLEVSGAPNSEYSDEAWARRVGNVTPQHVGRLRRVSERFGESRGEYAGLFWSHFQAALDWDDAEMWLEGAVRSDWSISEMRGQRWEVQGKLAGEQPTDEAEEAPWDEDGEDANVSGDVVSATLDTVRNPGATTDEDEDDDAYDDAESDADDYDADHDAAGDDSADRPEPVQPFAALPSLPADVSDAFEAFKLCILRHKVSGWQEFSRDELLVTLDALKQLALAPA